MTGASHEKVCDAIDRNEFSGFEDCLQNECAREVSADFIVTRNAEEFKHSRIKAITPQKLLEFMSENEV